MEETKAVEKVVEKSLSVIEQAKLIKIVDADSYIKVGDFWKTLKDMIEEVEHTFNPICEAADKAHKAATAQRAKYLNPLKDAYKSVKALMSSYDDEQERKRKDEQKRLDEIARKQEEERQIQAAIKAEENGDKEEAEAILEEPILPPPIHVQKETPKIQGGPVFRTVWKFRVVNLDKVPREYLMLDEKKTGSVVRAMKNQTRIDGIEVYEERV